MCMTNPETREEIVKKAEELAEMKIKDLYHEHCHHCGEDADEFDEEDMDCLIDAVCVLFKCAEIRRVHYTLEDMNAERIEQYKSTNYCQPVRSSATMPHSTVRTSATVAPVVAKG